jgi:hypothetical protein
VTRRSQIVMISLHPAAGSFGRVGQSERNKL